MTYSIKDHGIWQPYTPVPMPEWAQEASAIGGAPVFIRRGDGVDFYDFRNSSPFAVNAIVATTTTDAAGVETVGSVFRDPTMIFPFNQRLIEIDGVDPAETKPHNLFAWLTFHPDTLSFSGVPVPPMPPDTSTPSSCSKLGLKRAFEEQGLWPTVRAMIAGDAEMAEDWGLAIQIRINDPIVTKARAGLAQQGIGLSDADVQALVTRANELVA